MSSVIFAGTSVPHLATEIIKSSNQTLSLGKAKVTKFSDGEIRVEIENHVRGKKCVIIQSTCAPANDTLMELLCMADALKRACAERIIAILPYYGYARQDRRSALSRAPITAKLVAKMLETSGIDHVVTVDLHAMQIEGFFDIPVDNISATPLFVADMYTKWLDANPIIVSPDIGGVTRARAVAKHLDLDLAIIDKRRPNANVSEIMNIIGDVKDKTCIMIDDIVDTAGTLCNAANALMEKGAKQVVAYCSHPVLSGKAKQNLEESQLKELIVTSTIPLRKEFKDSKVRILSIGNLLGETISRIDSNQSVRMILD